jgi:hypothetical protein
MTYFRELQKRFRQHKSGAQKRGILFQLTFLEWLRIWEESGHLHERGRLGKAPPPRISMPPSIADQGIAMI